MPIPRDPKHPYPVPKLQEVRHEKMGGKRSRFPGTPDTTIQKENMMGDKTWRFPGTPSTTIRLPSYTSYKKGDRCKL